MSYLETHSSIVHEKHNMILFLHHSPQGGIVSTAHLTWHRREIWNIGEVQATEVTHISTVVETWKDTNFNCDFHSRCKINLLSQAASVVLSEKISPKINSLFKINFGHVISNLYQAHSS